MKKTRMLISVILAVSLIALSAFSASAAGKIKISDNELSLNIGAKTVLVLENVSKKNTDKIKWKSNDRSVAIVTKKGKITGVGEGKTTITAKYKKKAYKCEVTVAKNWTKEEIEALINSIVTGSEKLGLSKEEIEKMINEKISKIPTSSGGGGTTIIQQVVENKKEPEIYPSAVNTYSPYSHKITISEIKIAGIEENDLNSYYEKPASYFPGKYSLKVSVKGTTDAQWNGYGFSLCLYSGISNNALTRSENSAGELAIDEQGNFEGIIVFHLNDIPGKIYLGSCFICDGEYAVTKGTKEEWEAYRSEEG